MRCISDWCNSTKVSSPPSMPSEPCGIIFHCGDFGNSKPSELCNAIKIFFPNPPTSGGVESKFFLFALRNSPGAAVKIAAGKFFARRAPFFLLFSIIETTGRVQPFSCCHSLFKLLSPQFTRLNFWAGRNLCCKHKPKNLGGLKQNTRRNPLFQRNFSGCS